MAIPFVTRERVRWSDIDWARIIRYSAFPRFFEVAEAELFRAAGIAYPELFARWKISLPRRVMHVDFVSPAVLDDELELRVWIRHLGDSSLVLALDALDAPTRVLRATGYLVLVCTEVEVLEKRRIPDGLREALAPWVMTDEEARR